MFLELKASAVAKCREHLFGGLNTSQDEESYIFWGIGIPGINMRLFENFQNLVALQFDALASKK